jgi:hypothetical protein
MSTERRWGLLSGAVGMLVISAAMVGCGGSTSDMATAASSAGPAGVAPSVSGTPVAMVVANTAYNFRPSFVSRSGKPLSFNIQNKPAWASFGAQTGLLSGIPSISDAGKYSNIIIAASDGSSSTVLPGFSITVIPPTSTPPAAASSSSSSSGGTVSKTTSSSSSSSGSTVGKTTSSSSSSSGATPPPPPTTDTVTLSWSAPTQNTDGSALTNLAGFDIYYGTSASAMTQVINIKTVGLLDYVVSNLTPGTWYFEVVSVNAAGVESAPSGIVSTTI